MIYLTGFADEAADSIDGQIKAIQALGWSHIELRSVNQTNITDIPDDLFAEVVEKLAAAKIQANAFGSTICNWSKSILEPMDNDLEEIERAIPRMKALGTKHIRIMSYAVLPDRLPKDQLFQERVRRLQLVVDRFAAEGLQALHENCANYGGMGWQFTKQLIDHVPNLKLIFDTANAGICLDRSKPKPYPTQDAWEFYQAIKPHIAHVHIKDGIFRAENPNSIFEDANYVMPGQGHGAVKRIVADLIETGYDGGLSIEPHMTIVYHDSSSAASELTRTNNFVEYGKTLENIIQAHSASATFA